MENFEQVVNECYKLLKQNQSKYTVYDRYYRGDHDILHNYAMQDARSNMRVVCNFPRLFIDEEVSYVLGYPVNYIPYDNNKEVLNLIERNFSTWEKVHNQELLKQALIFGESYELQYINQDGDFKATVLTPLNCYVVESEDAESEVILALHSYKKSFDETEYIDVYFENYIYHYKVDDEKLIKIGEDTHFFSGVPVQVMKANPERRSLIDDIKSLNDSYNNVISDLVNEVSDFRTAFLTITNATVEEEDLLKMKKSGVIVVPNNGNVSFLIKNINDAFIQNLLETLENKIYQISGHINHTEKMQSNLSGVTMRSRLISLENKCALLQAQLEQVIKRRLRNFFEFIRLKTNETYDYRNIRIKFTPNVPQDIAVTANIINQLQNLVSQRTLLSLLPFVENVDLELEQFRKEKEMAGGEYAEILEALTTSEGGADE